MGYNYSRAFFEANSELVNRLLECARDDKTLHVEFDTPEEMTKAQFTVSNLLAVLSYYLPEHKQVRLMLRTWTEYAHERWHLYVGMPRHRIKGRRPELKFEQEIHQIADVRNTITEFKVSSPEDWAKFLLKITSIADGIVSVSFDKPIKSIEAFAPVMEKWNVLVAPGGTQVTLTRKAE